MPNFTLSEIITIILVILVVFGPHRLPEIARKAGTLVSKGRAIVNDLRSEFEGELREVTEPLKQVTEELKGARRDMQSSLKSITDDVRKAKEDVAGELEEAKKDAAGEPAETTEDAAGASVPAETPSPEKSTPDNAGTDQAEDKAGSGAAATPVPDGSDTEEQA